MLVARPRRVGMSILATAKAKRASSGCTPADVDAPCDGPRPSALQASGVPLLQHGEVAQGELAVPPLLVEQRE